MSLASVHAGGRLCPPYPRLRSLAELPGQPPPWLWPARIPLAALTLLAGDPGVGKSLLTIDLAARLSTAQPWPDDPAAERPNPADFPPAPRAPTYADLDRCYPGIRGLLGFDLRPTGALFIAPEDQPVLASRFARAGAAPDWISVLDGVYQPDAPDDLLPVQLPTHLGQLLQAVRLHDCARVVVLDPLSMILSPGVESSPALQAQLLVGLAQIARDRNVAILAVTHFGKLPARHPLHRIRGALRFLAAARSILVLTADPDDPARRVVTQIKSTYGPLAPPLALRVTAGPRLVWEPPSESDWRLATGALDLSPEHFSVLSEACAWLGAYLSTGAQPARELLRSAHNAGFPRTSLMRAKRLLQIRSRRAGTAWLWEPPAPAAPSAGVGAANSLLATRSSPFSTRAAAHPPDPAGSP